MRNTNQLELRIDADFIAYRACQVNEVEIDWGEHLVTISSNFKEVWATMQREISNLQQKFETQDVTLYFTHHLNFRKELDCTYKGKRIKRKPAGYKRLLDECREQYATVTRLYLEADDCMGIDCHLKSGSFILISPDKDMRQISCRHYNFSEEFEVTPEEADRFFFKQVLTGDPVDGYKGLPGCGEVNAEKILKKEGDPWANIVAAYEAKGLTEYEALHQARLARILRPGEYINRTPVLWTPTTSI